MKNIMLDLETLGTQPGSIILSIGAVVFNTDKGELEDEFYTEISVESSESLGLTKDASTMNWWTEQSPEARETLDACLKGEAVSDVMQALGNFSSWVALLNEDAAVWGNGSDFDNVLLRQAYIAADLHPPWKFYNNRCYRTLKNLHPFIKLERQGTYHNALDDAKTQARHALDLIKYISRDE